MKQETFATRLVFLLAVTAAAIGFSAFRFQDSTRQKTFREGYTNGSEDTTTRGKRNRLKIEYNLHELNEAIKEIDVQMLALERHIKSIDLSEIEQQLNKEFDADHIQKIEKEVNESLNKIDWEKVQSDLKKAVSQVKQLEAEQVKQNMNQLKLELEKQKEHFQIDGKKLRIQVEEGVQKAMEGMQKAKEELNEINKLTNTLEKDGLIDKNKPFKIEVRNGELFINGTKQSTEVNEKYKSYFKLNDYSIDNNPGKKRTVVI